MGTPYGRTAVSTSGGYTGGVSAGGTRTPSYVSPASSGSGSLYASGAGYTAGVTSRPASASAYGARSAAGVSRPAAGPRDEWLLEEFSSGGTRYLVDRATNRVYTNPTERDEWPRLVGLLGPGGRVDLAQAPPDLFAALDAYLKTNQMRLTEAFEYFDTDRSGKLDRQEVQAMLKKLLPQTTEAQLRYFRVMMDVEGGNEVTYEKLISVIKEVKAISAELQAKGELGTAEVLAKLSTFMAETGVSLRRIFDQFDTNHNGALDNAELTRLLQQLMPSLSSRDLRFILADMYRLDIEASGQVTYAALQQALQLVDVKRTAPRASVSVVSAASAPRSPGAGGSLGRDVFTAVDEYLKSSRLRLQEMFDEFDTDHDGTLSLPELERLMRRLLPACTAADCRYFLISADTNQDGRISYNELVAWLKLSQQAEVAVRAPARTEMASVIGRVATEMAREKVTVAHLFELYDFSRSGSLEHAELYRGLLRLLKQLPPKDLNFFMAEVYARDTAGTGRITQAVVRDILAAAGASGGVGGAPSPGAIARSGSTAAEQLVAEGVGMDLFAALDTYLKVNQMRLQDVYRQFDTNGDGVLDRPELQRLFRRLLPQASPADLSYLELMADADTGFRITYDALLEFLKQCKELLAGRRAPLAAGATYRPPSATLDALRRIGAELAARKVTIDQLAIAADPTGRYGGTIAPGDLLSGLQRYVPSLHAADTRAFLNEVYALDSRAAGGRVSVADVRALLSAATTTAAGSPRTTYTSAHGGAPPPGADMWETLAWYTSPGGRLSLRTAFDDLDVRRAGAIDKATQLPRLMRRLAPSATTVDLAAVALAADCDGRGTLNAAELESLLTETVDCREAVRAGRPEVAAALARIGNDLAARRVDVSTALAAGDAHNTGQVAIQDVPKLLLRVLPTAPPRELRMLSAQLAAGDAARRTGKAAIAEIKLLLTPGAAGERHGGEAGGGYGGTGGRGEVRAAAGVDFFTALDDHLKSHRLRLREVFDQFDTDGSNTLDRRELQQLVLRLMPHAAPGDLAYLQLMSDARGTGHLTYDDLVVFLQDCQAAHASAHAPRSVGAPQADPLLRLAGELRRCAVTVDQLVAVYDPRREAVEHAQLAAAIRRFVPTAAPRDLQHLMAEVYALDVRRTGRVTADQITALLYGGAAVPGYGGASPGARVSFSRGDDRLAIDVFIALDAMLKAHHVRLREAFDSFDGDHNGRLDRSELRRFLKHLLPDATPDDVRYFGFMADLDGDGAISYPELVEFLKSAQDAAAAAGRDAATGGYSCLLPLQDMLRNARATLPVLLREAGAASGAREVSHEEVVSAVRRIVPTIPHADLRVLVAELHARDTTRSGRIAVDPLAKLLGLGGSRGGTPGARSGGGPLPALSELMTPNGRRRLRDAFESADVGRRNAVDKREASRIVTRLLSDTAGGAEMAFITALLELDDGPGGASVTLPALEELCDSVLESADAVTATPPKVGVMDAGRRITAALSAEGITAESVFKKADSMTHREALRAISRAAPSASPRDLRTLLGELLTDDVDNTGRVTPTQLRRLLRGEGGGRDGSRGGRLGRDRDADAGGLRRHSSLVGGSREGAIGHEFYDELDKYLRERKVRLHEAFDEFDFNHDGQLDRHELSALLRQLLPNASSADVRYVQVMADADGDGVITFDELSDFLRDILAARKAMLADRQHAHKGLRALAKAIKKAKTSLKKLFKAASQPDTKGKGKKGKSKGGSDDEIDFVDLMTVLTKKLPKLTRPNIKLVMVAVQTADRTGEGVITLEAMEDLMTEATKADDDDDDDDDEGSSRRDKKRRSKKRDDDDDDDDEDGSDDGTGSESSSDSDGKKKKKEDKDGGKAHGHVVDGLFLASMLPLLKPPRKALVKAFKTDKRGGPGGLEDILHKLCPKAGRGDLSYAVAMYEAGAESGGRRGARSLELEPFAKVMEQCAAIESSCATDRAVHLPGTLTAILDTLLDGLADAKAKPGELLRGARGGGDLPDVAAVLARAAPKLEPAAVRYLVAELRAAEVASGSDGVTQGMLDKLLERATKKDRGDKKDDKKKDKDEERKKRNARLRGNWHNIKGRGDRTADSGWPARRPRPDGSAAVDPDAEDEDFFELLALAVKDKAALGAAFEDMDEDDTGAVAISLVPELAAILVPEATAADLRYVEAMIAADAGLTSYRGEADVDAAEFKAFVAECRDAGKSAREGKYPGGPDTVAAVRAIAAEMAAERVGVSDLFKRYDPSRSGTLEHRQLATALASMLPDLVPGEVRHLLAMVRYNDTSGGEFVTAEELDDLVGTLGGGGATPGSGRPGMTGKRVLGASSEWATASSEPPKQLKRPPHTRGDGPARPSSSRMAAPSRGGIAAGDVRDNSLAMSRISAAAGRPHTTASGERGYLDAARQRGANRLNRRPESEYAGQGGHAGTGRVSRDRRDGGRYTGKVLSRAAQAALDAANRADQAADVFAVLTSICQDVPDQVIAVFDDIAAEENDPGVGAVAVETLVRRLYPGIAARQLCYLLAVLDATGVPDPRFSPTAFAHLCRDGKALGQMARLAEVPEDACDAAIALATTVAADSAIVAEAYAQAVAASGSPSGLLDSRAQVIFLRSVLPALLPPHTQYVIARLHVREGMERGKPGGAIAGVSVVVPLDDYPGGAATAPLGDPGGLTLDKITTELDDLARRADAAQQRRALAAHHRAGGAATGGLGALGPGRPGYRGPGGYLRGNGRDPSAGVAPAVSYGGTYVFDDDTRRRRASTLSQWRNSEMAKMGLRGGGRGGEPDYDDGYGGGYGGYGGGGGLGNYRGLATDRSRLRPGDDREDWRRWMSDDTFRRRVEEEERAEAVTRLASAQALVLSRGEVVKTWAQKSAQQAKALQEKEDKLKAAKEGEEKERKERERVTRNYIKAEELLKLAAEGEARRLEEEQKEKKELGDKYKKTADEVAKLTAALYAGDIIPKRMTQDDWVKELEKKMDGMGSVFGQFDETLQSAVGMLSTSLETSLVHLRDAAEQRQHLQQRLLLAQVAAAQAISDTESGSTSESRSRSSHDHGRGRRHRHDLQSAFSYDDTLRGHPPAYRAGFSDYAADVTGQYGVASRGHPHPHVHHGGGAFGLEDLRRSWPPRGEH